MLYRELYEAYWDLNEEAKKDLLAGLTQAKRTAWALLADIKDRRGWSQEWDQFDNDMQNEIFATFVNLIETTK